MGREVRRSRGECEKEEESLNGDDSHDTTKTNLSAQYSMYSLMRSLFMPIRLTGRASHMKAFSTSTASPMI